MAERKSVCLRPGCGKVPRARGLCNACYTGALRLVSMKRTTWAQLEAQGRVTAASLTRNGLTMWLLGRERK